MLKNVADPAGFEPQPPDHQSNAHQNVPPRPAITRLLSGLVVTGALIGCLAEENSSGK